MKYSFKCLDKALMIILPGCDKWPGVGRSTLVEMAAKQCFAFPEKFSKSDEAFALLIVRTILIELMTTGIMTFGNVDEFWG